MKQTIQLRIRVLRPLSNVPMKVQRGKNELISPVTTTGEAVTFEFPIEVDTKDGAPNFLGKYAQGPKDQRFVYVNSGSYAGQWGTHWNRRAKISLMSITKAQVNEVIDDENFCLETEFEGVGRDGGPTCASVKGIEWKVVTK